MPTSTASVNSRSRLQFLEHQAASRNSLSEGEHDEQAQNLERQILAYRQAEDIVMQAQRRLAHPASDA